MNTAISAGKALLKKSMAFCSIDHISRIPSTIVIYSATVFDKFDNTPAAPQFPSDPVYDRDSASSLPEAAGTADDGLARTHDKGWKDRRRDTTIEKERVSRTR